MINKSVLLCKQDVEINMVGTRLSISSELVVKLTKKIKMKKVRYIDYERNDVF